MCPEGARVFLAYAAPGGRTLLDRELYLPKEWAQDAARRTEAGVPAAWVTGDEVYGRDRRLRIRLEEQGRPFVLAVATNEPLWAPTAQGPQQVGAADIAAAPPPEAWTRLSAGDGSKDPRLYDWARVRLARWPVPSWEHWLLARRGIGDPSDLAYYVAFAPAGTTLETLARVAGTRWAVEGCFQIAKSEVGLADYEGRRWDGWYRHITLALLAQAFLTVVRARAAGVEKGGALPCSPPR